MRGKSLSLIHILKDCDSTKEAINLSHAHALEQGTFDQKVFYEAFGILDVDKRQARRFSPSPADPPAYTAAMWTSSPGTSERR